MKSSKTLGKDMFGGQCALWLTAFELTVAAFALPLPCCHAQDPLFGPQNVIAGMPTMAAYHTWMMEVYAADLDGDGDLDILSASEWDDRIAWYENDGGTPPDFIAHIISTNANEANAVYAADLDTDGDVDVISGSDGDAKIAWYENDGAVDPTFTERVDFDISGWC